MYYDEAIQFVNEGYRMTRAVWDMAYISKDGYGVINYVRTTRIEDQQITTKNAYFSSLSDRGANDWKEYEE